MGIFSKKKKETPYTEKERMADIKANQKMIDKIEKSLKSK